MLIAALGVIYGAGMRVRDRMRVAIGMSLPTLEVGATKLGSVTCRGADNIDVTVGHILVGCGCSLDSRTTLGDGASVGLGMIT